ncbi:hypothetical protein B7P43_G17348 [Cryptotermes secundus]|uniref:Protein kinase domain-containing protein n=1 Tax=Cryptotermes secundus TaxID=105785 RepID=A0A2J7PNS1_9NEOP|nr:hypothetical protein B7P43_G17348 [Cryptotermes secundus]
MKGIDLKKHAQSTVRKEVCLHRVLTHPNIEQFYGNRREGNFEYIFLEFLSGGDLFDSTGGEYSSQSAIKRLLLSHAM